MKRVLYGYFIYLFILEFLGWVSCFMVSLQGQNDLNVFQCSLQKWSQATSSLMLEN